LCRITFFFSYFRFRVPHFGQTSPCCELWRKREGNYTRKQSHVIDILTSEDMENMSLCISQYLTLYYIINIFIIYLKNSWFLIG
jgi:hypothetical protein